MHEIICPHCGKAFKIDEAGYADIVKQDRNEKGCEYAVLVSLLEPDSELYNTGMLTPTEN